MATEGVTVISQQGSESFVPCVPGLTSDGYHTFDELYEHRCLLFALLLKNAPSRAWRSRQHDDGSEWDGWFIAGINLPIVLPDANAPITYHLPIRLWDLLDGIPTLDRAPKWDGHTSKDVLERIEQHLRGMVILKIAEEA